MQILLLGSGGREHAIAWKIKQSSLCKNLYVAPGNAGTSQLAENISISITDFEAIKIFCLEKNIDLLVIGPEEPLVKGIRDFFENDNSLQHILIIGPGQLGATLEGSKDFAKNFMLRHQIPTAAYQTFTVNNWQSGIEYLRNHTLPIVLKADGLAAGKGVVICQTYKEAEDTFKQMLLEKKFGEASSRVVVEQFLEGRELSVFIITDGQDYILLPEAKDYKRIGEGDTGLNTGGMGAISPVPFINAEFLHKIEQKIIEPTLKGLSKENIPYIGFIFFGLIKVNEEPFVIEYNVRLGDPETEVILPRLDADLVELMIAAAKKDLKGKLPKFSNKVATTIMLVSGGYPEDYQKGIEITNLDTFTHEVTLFHAGTKEKDNKILTNGGRVIALTALGDTFQEALEKSNQAADQVHFEGKYYRKDIGKDIW